MRALLVFVSVCGLWMPRTAAAFVCTAVPDADPPLTQAWNQRCVPFWINNDSPMLLTDESEQLVQDSFEEWSNQDCTDLNFRYAGGTSQGALFDPDSAQNKNVVLVVDTQAQADEVFDEPGLLAITLTSFSVETGEIFDADIVMNAAEFRFETVTNVAACRGLTNPPFDLQNTLVHEIGHFIGFDHTPEPEATMFASAQACETLKRDLAATDLDGVCTVYPTGSRPQTCAPPSSYGSSGFISRFRDQCDRLDCGCSSVEDGRPSWPLGLLLLALLAFRRRHP